MVLYPEVQRKAQAEIDRVIGSTRLPVYSDEDTLPFLQAVLKEVLRWHPVTPLSMCLSSCPVAQHGPHKLAGLSHRVTQSDVYEGHFIPAGSTVIPNVWYVPPYSLTLFSTDGFAGECFTTRKSSPSPIDSTRSVGFPRACPHSQTRPSVSGHGCVPVVSSLAGASGRIWLEYWLHSILRLRRTVLRREYTHQGSYRACFKNIYLAKWTRANGVSVADT